MASLEYQYDPGISKDKAHKAGAEPKAPFTSKADIFRTRVLGPRPVITRVDSAKDALVVSMNEKGCPDLEFMQNIYGSSG